MHIAITRKNRRTRHRVTTTCEIEEKTAETIVQQIFYELPVP